MVHDHERKCQGKKERKKEEEKERKKEEEEEEEEKKEGVAINAIGQDIISFVNVCTFWCTSGGVFVLCIYPHAI